MSSNRVSWIVAAAVVLVVGVLVVRTLQRDTSTRPTPGERPGEVATPGTSQPKQRPAGGDTAAAISPQERVSSVEKAKLVLKAKGYYDGPINGNYDEVLAASLKRFQQDNGMKPTGWLDPKTYAALGVELQRKR